MLGFELILAGLFILGLVLSAGIEPPLDTCVRLWGEYLVQVQDPGTHFQSWAFQQYGWSEDDRS